MADFTKIAQQIINDNPTLTSVEKSKIEIIAKKFSALERTVSASLFYYHNEKKLKFRIELNIRGEILITIVDFLDEDNCQDFATLIINRKGRLLVATDDEIEKIVKSLNKLTLEYGIN